PTLTEADLLEKITLAQKKSFCNFGLYVGASPTNVDNLGKLENLSGVCGVKLFMGSSTGNLVVSEDKLIEMALKNGKRRMAIHAEDENRLRERKQIVFGDPNANYKAELQFKAELPHSAELQYKPELHPIWRDAESAILATTKILKLARKSNRKIHVLHVSTAEEIEILKKNKDIASFEITPQHLTLHAPDCYLELGTLAQMNPPIRELRHQNALWQAVVDGDVSVLGSDHAPHTLEEKKKSYPDTPSGLTGVQTILPLMLHHAVNKKLSLHRVVELLAQNPARLFGILNKGEIREGFDADLTLVDLKAKKTIENSWIESRCGWTPFDGMKLNAWVKSTILAGQIVMKDDEIIGSAQGKMLKFSTLKS
ncbi:MAG: amidohydrolase family protein, partial [Bdellovibrionales bacterium]